MKHTLLVTSLTVSLVILAANAFAEHHEGEHESEKNEMQADTNHDGKVSFEEFKAARMKHMEAQFKRRDLNHDGFIDAEERGEVRAQKQAEKQAIQEEDKKALKEKYIEDKKTRKKHFFKYQ